MAPFNWIYNKQTLKKLIKEFNPDYIISEFEPVVLKAASEFNKPVYFIFNFDLDKQNPYGSKFLVQNSFIRLLYNNAKKCQIDPKADH